MVVDRTHTLEELLAADPTDTAKPEAADTSPRRRGGARITAQVHADLAEQVRVRADRGIVDGNPPVSRPVHHLRRRTRLPAGRGTVEFMRQDWVVEWAAREAERLLAPLGNRWVHTRAVAEVARRLAVRDDAIDGPVLVAAAYLHDLGYATALHDTGHHGLDGARYLAARGHRRLSVLVANHSGARHEAVLLGFAADLKDFPVEASATADALTYCDVITDAAGRSVTLAERFADVRRGYGPHHLVTRAMEQAYPDLERAVEAVEARVEAVRR